MYATDNAYDIMRYLVGRTNEIRILYDSNIKYWFIADASEYAHYHFVIEGWKNGLYADYNFESELDIQANYCPTAPFVYLYFYKEGPVQPNKTGDYGVHYFYDFGILDNMDIRRGDQVTFEDTELYNILLPRLQDKKVERTKRRLFN